MCRDTFSEKSLFHFEPSQVSFVLILSSLLGCLQARHAFIFPRNTTWPKNDALLRRKTCALLRAKTSALLRRKTCAVLRARTCALLRANTKEAAFGRLHKGGRPPKAATPLCGFLYGWVWGGWGGSRRGINTQVRRKISKSGEKYGPKDPGPMGPRAQGPIWAHGAQEGHGFDLF